MFEILPFFLCPNIFFIVIIYIDMQCINPIGSWGGGGFKSPPLNFCPQAFNFGATLLCVRDFSQKLVEKIF